MDIMSRPINNAPNNQSNFKNIYAREKNIYTKVANEMIDLEEQKMEQYKDKSLLLLNKLNGETIALHNMNQLYNDLNKKYNQVRLDSDDHLNEQYTTQRKVYYEDNEIENLQYYHTILIWGYYIVIAFYILFLFFTNKQYKELMNWIYLIFFICIPWIIRPFVSYFYEMKN
jgi:uncharacterized membrane protein